MNETFAKFVALYPSFFTMEVQIANIDGTPTEFQALVKLFRYRITFNLHNNSTKLLLFLLSHSSKRKLSRAQRG